MPNSSSSNSQELDFCLPIIVGDTRTEFDVTVAFPFASPRVQRYDDAVGIGTHFANVVDIPPPPDAIAPKTWPAHGAVVVLISAEDRLVQLFSTQNLRKAIQKRLFPSEKPEGPSRRANLREVTRQVGWTAAYSTFENAWRYLELSRILLPDSYQKALPFKPVWFAGINLAEEFPRWEMSTSVLQKPLEIGPFRGKKSCTEFISRVEDYFELCRKHEELVKAPHGAACAYFDMGRCPAPCNGTVTLAAYRDQLDRSAAFSMSGSDDRLRILKDEMNSASRALRFEQASFLKAALNDAEKNPVATRDYRGWPRPVDRFRYFVLQRGSSRNRWRPFFADCRGVEQAEEFEAGNLDKLVPEWWGRWSSTSGSGVDNTTRSAELISLVAFYGGKRGRGSGLFLHRDDIASMEEMQTRIREFVSRTTPVARLSDNG